MDAIGIFFAQLVHRIGDYGLPINVEPAAATQLFGMRNTASDRRIEVNKWGMDSRRPECRDFSEEINRNVDRARVRTALGQSRLRVEADVDIRDEKGIIAHDPPDDKSVPQVCGAFTFPDIRADAR